jgi:hypothetical protein
MSTLLVLGAKPEPVLPPTGAFDAVACANASGQSAARLGLPTPVFTVMSAILTDGSAAGRMRLLALRGLETERLYYYPRPAKAGSVVKRAVHAARNRRLRPPVLRRALAEVGYRYGELVLRSAEDYRRLINELCGPDVALQVARKQASSGALAVVLGVADPRFNRVVVSGFSFELTQAAGLDPEIARRGTDVSRHRDSDIAVLRALAERHGVCTTEPVVHQAAGVPLFSDPRC